MSARDGSGLGELMAWLKARATDLIPTSRDRGSTSAKPCFWPNAARSVQRASAMADPVLKAEELRLARNALDRISGLSGVESLLDALFGRFCLGK